MKPESSLPHTQVPANCICPKPAQSTLEKKNIYILPANPPSSRPNSWSPGNTTFVVAEGSGWRRVIVASKPRLSANGAHRYRKRARLEVLRLATTKPTQRGIVYPSRGHPTQLRISRGSAGLIKQTTPHAANCRLNAHWTRQINTERTGFYTCKEFHKTESLQNHTTTVHREREKLGDQRNVGESSCNCGDGTGQRTHSLMFMMTTIIYIYFVLSLRESKLHKR
jgi:hypothetical protein